VPQAASEGGGDIANQLGQHSAEAVGKLATQVLPVAVTTVSVVVGIVLVLALAFFFAHEPDWYHAGIRNLVPRDRELVLEEAWRKVSRALRHWMVGILASMTIMGSLTAVGLLIAGVDGWPTLALLTFLGTFVPYAGAIASAVPGLAVALADSPRRFIYAMIVYLMVHLVEGYIVQPLIMKHAVSLRPATLLFWQLLMGTLFGALGIIAATPLLACVVVAVDYLYVERVLGKPTEV
jgi:predicted PurR-regulated permease PerM